MDKKWRIKIYESQSGEKYIEEFIKSLDEKTQLKISRTLDLLEEFGLEGAYPHVKKLASTPLWELRILGADSIRLFYVTTAGRVFLLLHGFKKNSQKTPSREIITAKKRLNEYQSRKTGS